MGLSWHYNLSLSAFTMSNHPDELGIVREALIEHAQQHNALVQRILDTFNLTPKPNHHDMVAPPPEIHVPTWDEVFLKYMESLNSQLDKKSEEKPNDYRRIELDEETEKT